MDAGAAKLLGKKVKVTVGHVLDGVAFATLADSAKPGARITFEAEAEKPTRAPSRKKTAAAAPDDRELEVAGDEPDEEAPELAAEETVIPVDEDDVAPDAPKKKRTRRGTRGGKSRKKTPTASVVAPDPDVDGGTPTPTIHLPPGKSVGRERVS